MKRPIVLLAALSLGGCAAAPDLLGLGAGGAAGAATANPAIALAVGIGVRAAAREGLSIANRIRQNTRQEAIAETAGTTTDNARFTVKHWLDLGNSQGKVRILRDIATPIATCKEVAFEVEGDGLPYITFICPKGDGWAWGQAEPAVARWGNLQ